MLRTLSRWGTIGVLGLMLLGEAAEGAISGLQRVASGLSNPVFVTHAPGDRARLFIVELGGTIKILNLTSGTVEAVPFLTIPDVNTNGEGGLLGMAFHPDYVNNGKFYVNVTVSNATTQMFQGATSPFSTHIRQYTASANPNIASPTPKEVLSFLQPQSNHNAGWIGFNPAVTQGQPQYLYIPTGDGGGSNDHDNNGGDLGHTPVTGNAQDITDNLLGKILRIDVNVPPAGPGETAPPYLIPVGNPFADTTDDMGMPVVVPGDDEIWAIGMRNPFRDSFDRKTGDLWLGDVGQNTKEEIDRQPANAVGGDNFGWRNYEGIITPPPSLANYRQPEYDYGRPTNTPSDAVNEYRGTVVTGGYVYRGPDPSLQGKYFFLDSRNSSGAGDDNYWMFDPANPFGTVANIDALLTPNAGTPQFPVSFGEDAVGNLYIAYLVSGDVYRIATNQVIAGDYDGDGKVDSADYNVWKAFFGLTTPLSLVADGNKNNIVDAADYVVWRNNLGAKAQGGAGSGSLVPEPATALLIALSAVMIHCFARKRPPTES